MSASRAAGLTHTAAMIRLWSASSSLMIPSLTASATPPATPACAAPQVRVPCSSSAMGALLTNSVIGLTGSPGITTATNGACPALGRGQRGGPGHAHRPGALAEDGVHVRGLGALTDVALADEHLGLLGAKTRESCCTRTISGPAPAMVRPAACSRHGGRKPGHRRSGSASAAPGIMDSRRPVLRYPHFFRAPSCRPVAHRIHTHSPGAHEPRDDQNDRCQRHRQRGARPRAS